MQHLQLAPQYVQESVVVSLKQEKSLLFLHLCSAGALILGDPKIPALQGQAALVWLLCNSPDTWVLSSGIILEVPDVAKRCCGQLTAVPDSSPEVCKIIMSLQMGAKATRGVAPE